MFGIEDPYILAAYAMSLGLGLLCIIYGIINWNKEGEDHD